MCQQGRAPKTYMGCAASDVLGGVLRGSSSLETEVSFYTLQIYKGPFWLPTLHHLAGGPPGTLSGTTC